MLLCYAVVMCGDSVGCDNDGVIRTAVMYVVGFVVDGVGADVVVLLFFFMFMILIVTRSPVII